MVILGLSCFSLNSAAVLLVDGKVTAAAEEERFTRQEKITEIPEQSVNFCLEQGGVKIGEVDHVASFGNQADDLKRISRSMLSNVPGAFGLFKESYLPTLWKSIKARGLIARKLKISPAKIHFVKHHPAHAASAFFSSPFNDTAIMVVDTVGGLSTTSTGTGVSSWKNGKENRITLDQEIRYPDSLGLLYSTFTDFLGFKVNGGEYKLMGLASYGKPVHAEKIKKIVKIFPDGSFILDPEYFCFHCHPGKMFNRKFMDLFGNPANYDFFSGFYQEGNQAGIRKSGFENYADIAASIQKVIEEILVKLASALYEKTKCPNLCIAGEVGLNCVANGKIMMETPFRNLFVQPAAGVAGGAMGAAFYLHHIILNQPRTYTMTNAYLGKEYSEIYIRNFLVSNHVDFRIIPDDKLLDELVEAMLGKKVIGWFQGRFEWGPRALGNRSILADPRVPELKDIINLKIKFREPFRPFAPAVLAEEAAEYFELGEKKDIFPLKFMTTVAKVRPEKRDTIPAVTHVDGTGRPQAVTAVDNPRFYNLIKAFQKKTGIPVLLNTSFNLQDEPIVNSPEDAYSTFMRSGIDMLVMENFLIIKNQAGYEKTA